VEQARWAGEVEQIGQHGQAEGLGGLGLMSNSYCRHFTPLLIRSGGQVLLCAGSSGQRQETGRARTRSRSVNRL